MAADDIFYGRKKMMAKDLIALFCKGEGKRFNGIRCEHYEIFTKECDLLKKDSMKDVFEKGRCKPSVMAENAVRRNLFDYRDKINPKEDKGIAWEVCDIIKKKRLNTPILPVLIGYINKTVYTEVIRILIEKGILIKGECGKCIYLSLSKPYICQRADIIKDGKKFENPLYGEKRNPSDSACKDGFEPPEFNGGDDVDIYEAEGTGEGFTIIIDMQKLLIQRIKKAKDENTKKRYERQYAVFCRFLTLMQDGHSEKEALKIIAEKFDPPVSVKTVERDMTEVRDFLKTKMSSED
jgi:hypothetical protein